MSTLPDYEARRYYQNPAVAAQYDAQFRRIRSWDDLRAQVLARFEERAFDAMLERAAGGGTVLDIACGTGRYVRRLLRRGYQVVGTDVSAEMLAVARAATPADHRLLALEQADAARLPFPDGHFDGVTCMRLYHRIPPDLRLQMLLEVRRVGRGWAILFFGMTNGWLRVRQKVRESAGGRPTNPYALSDHQLRRDLGAIGMELRDSRWVLPGLANGRVTLVTW